VRYGIFSDTHANIEALNTVLTALEDDGVDRFVCLGDTVGYGGSPNECCDRVRDVAAFTILGNHDAAVAGRMDYSYYYDAAREALDTHREELTDDNLEWLKGLPYEVKENDLAFCHGSPLNLEEFEYIFSKEQAARCLEMYPDLAVATFIGHSHLCKSFALSETEVHEVVTTKFELRPDHRYIISVGSVGQPRDGNPLSAYTILDTDESTFEFKRVSYDIDGAADKIRAAKLSPSFAERLFIGF